MTKKIAVILSLLFLTMSILSSCRKVKARNIVYYNKTSQDIIMTYYRSRNRGEVVLSIKKDGFVISYVDEIRIDQQYLEGEQPFDANASHTITDSIVLRNIEKEHLITYTPNSIGKSPQNSSYWKRKINESSSIPDEYYYVYEENDF